VTNDTNAVVTVTPSANLTGTEAERTTTVLITAEDQVATKTYYVIFDVAVGIDDHQANMVGIYPIPAMDYLNITNAGDIKQISIVSLTGATLRVLEVSGEQSGTYFLELAGQDSVRVMRFIKK
jgi:hypothetical protein